MSRAAYEWLAVASAAATRDASRRPWSRAAATSAGTTDLSITFVPCARLDH